MPCTGPVGTLEVLTRAGPCQVCRSHPTYVFLEAMSTHAGLPLGQPRRPRHADIPARRTSVVRLSQQSVEARILAFAEPGAISRHECKHQHRERDAISGTGGVRPSATISCPDPESQVTKSVSVAACACACACANAWSRGCVRAEIGRAPSPREIRQGCMEASERRATRRATTRGHTGPCGLKRLCAVSQSPTACPAGRV